VFSSLYRAHLPLTWHHTDNAPATKGAIVLLVTTSMAGWFLLPGKLAAGIGEHNHLAALRHVGDSTLAIEPSLAACMCRYRRPVQISALAAFHFAVGV
jgi:hypothetical protein